MIPEDLKYAKSHEWVRVEGSTATVGITHHAQEQLTDIVFVELPETGRVVTQGSECAVIESTKVAADLYAPVSGKIVATNEALNDNPGAINQDAFGDGWVLTIEMSDPSELDILLNAAAYRTHLDESG